MAKKSNKRKRHKQAKTRPDDDLRLYCPMCRKDDLLTDSDAAPQMFECGRCGVVFFVEDVPDEADDTNDTELDIGELDTTHEPKHTASKHPDKPVLGSMVEITEFAHV